MSVKSATRQSGGPKDGATTKVAVYLSVEHATTVLLTLVPAYLANLRRPFPISDLNSRARVDYFLCVRATGGNRCETLHTRLKILANGIRRHGRPSSTSTSDGPMTNGLEYCVGGHCDGRDESNARRSGSRVLVVARLLAAILGSRGGRRRRRVC